MMTCLGDVGKTVIILWSSTVSAGGDCAVMMRLCVVCEPITIL